MEFVIKKIDNHWEVFDGEEWHRYKDRWEALNEVMINLPDADYIKIETEILK